MNNVRDGGKLFFVPRGVKPNQIACWGDFAGYDRINRDEAWTRYGREIGAASQDDWRSLNSRLYSVEDSPEIIVIHATNLTVPSKSIAIAELGIPNPRNATKGWSLGNEDVERILRERSSSEESLISESFFEGNRVLSMHLRLERNQQVVRLAKLKWKQENSSLPCSKCGFSFVERFGMEYIEAHHIIPLSYLENGEVVRTTVDDLVAVCSNCHRAIHWNQANLAHLAREAEYGGH